MNYDPKNSAPATPVDSGSQAMAEALRSSFGIVKFLMAALFILFLASGFFTVGPQEKAVILRFGKPVGEGEKALLGSGLHWAWPYPVDDVVKIPITEIQKVTASASWFFQTPEQAALNEIPPAGPTLNPAVDGYALTADGNIVHLKATLSYRIEDPVRCVFEFAAGPDQNFSLAGVSNAVMNALDNALVQTAAHFTVDDLLLNDVLGFKDAVQRRGEKLMREQRLGVVVEQCIVQSLPPRQLKQAFDNVVTANQKSGQVVDAARSDASKTLGRAESEAVGLINAAESARTRMVESLTAEKIRFLKLLPAYESNPSLFVQQRVIESVGKVFTNAADKMFLPTSADGKPVELRLLLNREPQKTSAEQTK